MAKEIKNKKSVAANTLSGNVKKLDTPKNNFYIVAAVVIILAGFYIYLNPPKKDTTINNQELSTASSETTLNEVSKPKNIAYKGQTGKTALELLTKNFPTEVSGTGANAFVTAINEYKPDINKEYWSLYVNGKQAEVGAGTYQSQDSDLIEWRLEQIVK